MEFAEHIKTANVENVVLTQQLEASLKGTLCVTGHHLLLFGRDGDSTAQLLLLLRNIDAVEKRAIESSGTITVKCKDLRILQLDIPGMEECLNVASSIEVCPPA
uniref:MTMR6-9 GRAM domain-containing protein n=1 Tax=Paramormyrops kingsleyae TaxID=1676925 RepID=A0A3B3SLL2_9TELE